MKSNCYHGEGGCAMPENVFDVVTGASGYTGRYITRLLLSRGRRVRTLTGHPARANPFGDQIESAPFNFDCPDDLARSFEGAGAVFNTYWIRFPYGGQTFDSAVANTRA
jgi:nucleoside-diphosphate-sugar epimerase